MRREVALAPRPPRRLAPVPKGEPPEGPPWDAPLAEAPFAFLDLEMTGLDPEKDRVVEICVERVRGVGPSASTAPSGEVEARLSTLVRPDTLAVGQGAPAVGADDIGNTEIHGIGADELAGAPTYAEIADRVAELLDGAVPIAHGAAWDVAFLDAESARAGRPSPVSFYVDTLNLSRRTFGLARHSLDALREHFGLDRARAHRADADVVALRCVFDRCVAELEPRTPRDVWQVRVRERKARDEILNDCHEAIAAKTPVTVLYRPRSRAAEPMRMVLTSVVLGLDPPRVIGYQLPGRGRRELRADRILRIERDETP